MLGIACVLLYLSALVWSCRPAAVELAVVTVGKKHAGLGGVVEAVSDVPSSELGAAMPPAKNVLVLEHNGGKARGFFLRVSAVYASSSSGFRKKADIMPGDSIWWNSVQSAFWTPRAACMENDPRAEVVGGIQTIELKVFGDVRELASIWTGGGDNKREGW